MTRRTFTLVSFVCSFFLFSAGAQSPSDMVAINGLAPVAVLPNTVEGRAALSANYTVTGTLQTGLLRQATPLPFAEQQQQALRDVFMTRGNLSQLADGLGTALGAAYIARAHYINRSTYRKPLKSVGEVIAYADAVSSLNSDAGKYFFANLTIDGIKPVSSLAIDVLKHLAAIQMYSVKVTAVQRDR